MIYRKVMVSLAITGEIMVWTYEIIITGTLMAVETYGLAMTLLKVSELLR